MARRKISLRGQEVTEDRQTDRQTDRGQYANERPNCSKYFPVSFYLINLV